jgi:hypothetical protein
MPFSIKIEKEGEEKENRKGRNKDFSERSPPLLLFD